MRYYVYALIDPSNGNKPFYIGKGIDDRVKSHFRDAKQGELVYNEEINIDIDISLAAENDLKEYAEEQANSPKILKLKELLKDGYKYENIARILAKNLEESVALALESFLIKTIYGLNNLTNIVEGTHSNRFRPHNNWDCLEGFDVPVATNKKISSSRIEKLQMMLAEKRDKPLIEIEKAFPNLKFEAPNILDSGELGIEADVEGTRIKIFTRKNNIQIELRGRKKEQHIWINKHFRKLESENLLRKDNVFLPNAWKGSKNMTSDVKVAIKRVGLLLEIIGAESKDVLSKDALNLLK